MAQEVDYWENDVNYSEGPFVYVYLNSGRYRIEVDHGGLCPQLPDRSIHLLQDKLGHSVITMLSREKAISLCDKLNEMVCNGEIIQNSGLWICKED